MLDQTIDASKVIGVGGGGKMTQENSGWKLVSAENGLSVFALGWLVTLIADTPYQMAAAVLMIVVGKVMAIYAVRRSD